MAAVLIIISHTDDHVQTRGGNNGYGGMEGGYRQTYPADTWILEEGNKAPLHERPSLRHVVNDNPPTLTQSPETRGNTEEPPRLCLRVGRVASQLLSC